MTYLTTPTKRGWGWDDFDHSQTLSIGYSASTCIAYQKISFTCVVLKSCPESSYTPIRRWLAEIALAQSKDASEKISKNSLFLPTICCFKYQNRRYVGSMLSDISLADIISCTILLQESHLASVLEQVTYSIGIPFAYSTDLRRLLGPCCSYKREVKNQERVLYMAAFKPLIYLLIEMELLN